MVKFYKPSDKALEVLENLTRQEGFPIGQGLMQDGNGTAAARLALIDAILETAPKKVVEVGAGPEGYSTVCIIAALNTLPKEPRQLATIDIRSKDIATVSSPYAIQHFRHYKKCFGTTSVEYHEKLGDNIELLEIDGNHRYPWPMFDFLAFLPHLAPGATVFFHDYFSQVDFGSVSLFIASLIGWKHTVNTTYVLPSKGRKGYGIEAVILKLDDLPFEYKETTCLVTNLLGAEWINLKSDVYPKQQDAAVKLLHNYYCKTATAAKITDYVIHHTPDVFCDIN